MTCATMRRLRLLLVVGLLAVPTAVAATSGGECRELPGAGTPTDPVEICASRAWFERAADTRVANLGGVARAVGEDDPSLPGWAPDPPAASAADGAGAIYTAHAAGADAGPTGVASARFEGSVTGNLDTVALDFYMVTSHEYDEYLPGSLQEARACSATASCEGIYPIVLSLEVDGQAIDVGEVESYLYPPRTSGNLVAMRFRVAVTGLFDGHDDPSAVHDIAVEVLPHEAETTLLFDAAEWPSKILFNPPDTTSYRVVPADHGDGAHA